MGNARVLILILSSASLCGCFVSGPEGPPGADGKEGAPGVPGAVSAGAPEPVNGSRLQIRYRHYTQQGDDGSLYVFPTLTTSLWDTQRGEYCGWQRAEDGVTRCLPDASAGVAAFEDAACTVAARIFHMPSCGELGSVGYFAVAGADACAGMAFYEKGVDAVPSAEFWYVKVDGMCTSSGYSASEYKGWRLGAYVAPTEFQSGKPRQLVEYSLP